MTVWHEDASLRGTAEYLKLKPYLAETVPSLMDVGCGSGAISAMFALYSQTKTLHLLDGDDDVGPKRMGYHAAGKPWRSTRKAAATIRKWVPPPIEIFTYTPLDPWPDRVDLVISLWSWGFHYPVGTYAKQLSGIDAPLIIDIRRTLEAWSIKTLRRIVGYGEPTVIDQNNKASRFYFKRVGH